MTVGAVAENNPAEMYNLQMDLRREEKTYFCRYITLCSCVLWTFRQYCSRFASSVHVIEQHSVHETRLKQKVEKMAALKKVEYYDHRTPNDRDRERLTKVK